MDISLCENTDYLNNALRMVKVINPAIDLSRVYELNQNGLKKLLVVNNEKYYIITLVNELFYSIDFFEVDDNGKIKYLCFHNSNLTLKDGIAFSFSNDLNPSDSFDYYRHFIGYVTNSVTVMKTDNISDRYNDYNAVIFSLDYNLEKEMSLKRMYLYQARFDGTDRLNSSYCSHPFYLCLNDLKENKTREFFLTQWNRNMKYYGLALLKFVGLMDYFNDSDLESFEYYYDKPIFGLDDRVNVGNLLLSNMYDDEGINKVLEDYGFSVDIPEELFDLYNGENKNYVFARNVLEAYNSYLAKVKKLVKG